MAEWIVDVVDGGIHIKRMTPLVRCKDCIHRPLWDEDSDPQIVPPEVDDTGLLEFPQRYKKDWTCPLIHDDDGVYSEYPDDNFYCALGERKD